MARAGDVRLCPSCGTRNKAKWEFCVRCGESLQDVAVGEETVVASAATAVAAPATGDEAAAEQAPSLWSVAALIALIGGAGLYFASGYRPPERPDPGIFVAPTLPPERPPSSTVPPLPASRQSLEEGRRLLRAGKFTEAARALAQAVAELAGESEPHYLYAQALWNSGDKRLGLEEYREAARYAPANDLYLTDLAKALAATGRTAEAIAQYEAALAVQPNAAGSLRALASLQRQSGNHAKAVEALTRALAVQPRSVTLQEDLAYALEHAGRKDDAIAAYRKALVSSPGSAVSRGLLANLLWSSGRKEEAFAVVREGMQRDAKAPLLHRALGTLLEFDGQIAGAVAEYREYARLAPGTEDAKQLAERARLLEERAAGSS